MELVVGRLQFRALCHGSLVLGLAQPQRLVPLLPWALGGPSALRAGVCWPGRHSRAVPGCGCCSCYGDQCGGTSRHAGLLLAATGDSTCGALACASNARPLGTGTAQLVLGNSRQNWIELVFWNVQHLLTILFPLLATLAAARGPMALAIRSVYETIMIMIICSGLATLLRWPTTCFLPSAAGLRLMELTI
jgi:hypothetical protein